MSVEKDSNTETVFVRLLDEGTDVMRPVPASRVSNGIYKLLKTDDYDPEYETWEFLPGKRVLCERRGAEAALIAVAEADDNV